MSGKKVDDGSDAVAQLYRDLYLVKSNLIRYADGEMEINGVQFINPRCTVVNGKPLAKGMDRSKMEEIRESIRTQGLKHPLILYGKPTGHQAFLLLSGERRKRSLDKLIADKTPCFNPETGGMVPANELYEHIECRITSIPDLKALYKEAFTINETSEDIGESAVVSLVKQWKDSEMSDEDILEITNKSVTWLRDTLAIISLDEKCYSAFLDETINRTVAIALSEEKDDRKRQTRLAEVNRLSAERLKASIADANRELEEAEQEAEIAKVNAEIATSQSERKDTLRKVKKADEKVAAKEEKVKSLTSRRVKAGSKDLEKVKKEFDGGSGKRLTRAKYEKHWLPELQKLSEGSASDIDPHDAHLVMEIFRQVDQNSFDIADILRNHKHSKTKG